MPAVFWTGKLPPVLKFVVNLSNAFAWVTGNARDATKMKARMKRGYDGSATDDVTRYDELGLAHYTAISEELLAGMALRGRTVLDVGCGTGIQSLLAVDHGAARVVCGDQSEYMLARCEQKAHASGRVGAQMLFRQLDAEALPYDSDTFDAVISGMALGLMPDQAKAIAEMARVLKPGGTLAVSTHGPDHYCEASRTAFSALPKAAVFGYRVEFWPRTEKAISRMFSEGGLADVRTRRLTWRESFDDGGSAYEFFASTSSAWWYSRFSPDKVASLARRVRSAFERENVREITTDVILAYGRRP